MLIKATFARHERQTAGGHACVATYPRSLRSASFGCCGERKQQISLPRPNATLDWRPGP